MTSEQAKTLEPGDLVTLRKKEYKGLIFQVLGVCKDPGYRADRPSNWGVVVGQPNVKGATFTYMMRAQDMDIWKKKEEA